MVLCRARQTPAPLLLMHLFNPARIQTQRQQDCSLNFNNEATTALCTLLFAQLTAQSDEVGPMSLMVLC